VPLRFAGVYFVVVGFARFGVFSGSPNAFFFSWFEEWSCAGIGACGRGEGGRGGAGAGGVGEEPIPHFSGVFGMSGHSIVDISSALRRM